MSYPSETIVLDVLGQALIIRRDGRNVSLGGSILPALGDTETDEFVAHLIESLIVSHASLGLDIADPSYAMGVEAALNHTYDRLT